MSTFQPIVPIAIVLIILMLAVTYRLVTSFRTAVTESEDWQSKGQHSPDDDAADSIEDVDDAGDT